MPEPKIVTVGYCGYGPNAGQPAVGYAVEGRSDHLEIRPVTPSGQLSAHAFAVPWRLWADLASAGNSAFADRFVTCGPDEMTAPPAVPKRRARRKSAAKVAADELNTRNGRH